MTDLTALHHTVTAQLTGPGAPFEVVTLNRGNHSVKAYKNAPATLLAILNEGRQFGSQLFIDSAAGRYSFDEFFSASDQLASYLQHSAAIAPGQRVAIAMRNSAEWLISFTAIISIGAVVVPLNSWGRSEELHQGLTDSDAQLVICDGPRASFIEPQKFGIKAIVCADGVSGAESWTAALAAGNALPAATADPQPDDAAILLFTSGTSGRPKGAQFSHFICAQGLFNIEFIGASTYMTNSELQNSYMAKQIPAKTLLAVPLFHISGLFSQFIVNLKFGRALYLMYKWDAAEAERLVKEQGITVLMGAPTMLIDLLERGNLSHAETARISNISAGGAATPSKLYDLYDQHCPETMSGAGWGLTESGGTGAAFTGPIMRHYRGASGFVSPIVELKFCDEQGAALAQGERGEIWIRSASTIDRYVSGSDSQSDFSDGWFKTGDVGYLSEEGLLYLCDRAKDMIIRGGENIYPVEIENCLLSLPGVAEVAVVGIPCEQYGEQVAAVVRCSGQPLDEAAIRNHCQSHLAGFKVPSQIVFTQMELPRNATKKLLKQAIANAYFG